jgi:plasmid stabilization system protein ParE
MKIYLSKQAEYKLNITLTYILKKWSLKERDNFLRILDNKFKQISKHPESCPKSEKFNGIHKCVLSKQTIFFYRINNNSEIEIITFFDTRQNPEFIKFEI